MGIDFDYDIHTPPPNSAFTRPYLYHLRVNAPTWRSPQWGALNVPIYTNVGGVSEITVLDHDLDECPLWYLRVTRVSRFGTADRWKMMPRVDRYNLHLMRTQLWRVNGVAIADGQAQWS